MTRSYTSISTVVVASGSDSLVAVTVTVAGPPSVRVSWTGTSMLSPASAATTSCGWVTSQSSPSTSVVIRYTSEPNTSSPPSPVLVNGTSNCTDSPPSTGSTAAASSSNDTPRSTSPVASVDRTATS